MSIFVSDFGTWGVTHDDAPGGLHKGTIDPILIIHPLNPDGTENHNFLIVPCPICDSASNCPIGGGAQPIPTQSLFTVIAYERSCPCGALTVDKETPLGNVAEHIKQHCEAMDGEGRWQLDDAAVAKLEQAIRVN